jgi:hypothetical protein
MAIEGRRDTVIYKVIVPISGAVLGAVIATWIRSASIDNAQLKDILIMIQDSSLTGSQKLQALQLYREITDRPWSILRSLVSSLTVVAGMIGAAWAFRIQRA